MANRAFLSIGIMNISGLFLIIAILIRNFELDKGFGGYISATLEYGICPAIFGAGVLILITTNSGNSYKNGTLR